MQQRLPKAVDHASTLEELARTTAACGQAEPPARWS